MKNKVLVILLVFVIIALVISNCIFIFKYKEELKNNNSNAELSYKERIEYEEKIDELKKELSKYDSNSKNEIDITFNSELKEIDDDNLTVIGIENENPTEFYPNMTGEYKLTIDDKTEIIYKDDVVDKSYLKSGQTLKVTFSSEVQEEYSSTLNNIKKIEIL